MMKQCRYSSASILRRAWGKSLVFVYPRSPRHLSLRMRITAALSYYDLSRSQRALGTFTQTRQIRTDLRN